MKKILRIIIISVVAFVAYFIYHVYFSELSKSSGEPPTDSIETYYVPQDTEAVSAYVVSAAGEEVKIETSEAEGYPIQSDETLVVEYDNGMVSEITDIDGPTTDTESGTEDGENLTSMTSAYVVDESGERTDFNRNDAEAYVVQEGEVFTIEYENGWVVHTTVK